MDLLTIGRTMARHKWLTIPIVCLTAAAVVFILAFTPSRYEATSSYVLFTPPAGPSADDIKANPLLGLVHVDNPYARMDPAVVVNLVAQRVNGDSIRTRLAAQGADDRYEVTTGGLYGLASPTADVRGVGDDPASAIKTARIVGAEFASQLHAMQAVEQTDDEYMVKASAVQQADSAEQKVSSRLRSIFGVLALGALLLFAAISIGEAVDKMRRERKASPSFFVPDSALTVPTPSSPRRLWSARLRDRAPGFHEVGPAVVEANGNGHAEYPAENDEHPAKDRAPETNGSGFGNPMRPPWKVTR
jgi:hypothetical protein